VLFLVLKISRLDLSPGSIPDPCCILRATSRLHYFPTAPFRRHTEAYVFCCFMFLFYVLNVILRQISLLKIPSLDLSSQTRAVFPAPHLAYIISPQLPFTAYVFCRYVLLYVLNAILRHISLLKIPSPLAICRRPARNSHSRPVLYSVRHTSLTSFPHSSLPKTYGGVCFLLFYVSLDVLNVIIRYISLKISSPLVMCRRLMDVYMFLVVTVTLLLDRSEGARWSLQIPQSAGSRQLR